MRCPHCNAEHPESMHYCPNTGQHLQNVLKCPKCGNSDIPSGSRFCPKCGTLLKSPDKENIREFVRAGTQEPSKKGIYSGSPSDLIFDIMAAILCVVGVISGIIVLSMGELWGLISLIGFSLIGAGRIWARKDFYHFK